MLLPYIPKDVTKLYHRKIVCLPEALSDPDTRPEAGAAIRSLVDRVTVTPGQKRGQVYVTLQGELGSILDWVNEPGSRNANTPSTIVPGVLASVVAGEGFEPSTFRL